MIDQERVNRTGLLMFEVAAGCTGALWLAFLLLLLDSRWGLAGFVFAVQCGAVVVKVVLREAVRRECMRVVDHEERT